MVKKYTETVIITINNAEIECVVEFWFTPGEPGKYHGRPEDCYPATGDEYELWRLTTSDADPVDLSCLLDLDMINNDIEGQLAKIREETGL